MAKESPCDRRLCSHEWLSSLVCLDSLDPGLDSVLLLIVGKLLVLVLQRLLLPFFLGLLLPSFFVLLERVFPDGLVCLGVEVLQALGLNVVIDVALELRLVALLVVVG